MNDNLVETLRILRECRVSLVQSYLKTDSDCYHYSFRYGESPAAFEIARSLIEHQWIDRQYLLASSKFERGEISLSCYKMFLGTLNKYFMLQLSNISHKTCQEINLTKISALESLLASNDIMSDRVRKIEFDYYRDKVLFEREITKYLNQCE